MGLGLYIIGHRKAKGLLRISPSKETLMKNIENFFINIDDTIWKRLIRIIKSEKLEIFIHPAEEPVEFFFKGEKIVCSAKTSDAGPGYHNYLVDLLIECGKNCNIEWQWEDKIGDIGDETEYYKYQDFEKLQLSMAEWLTALAKHTAESRNGRTHLCTDVNILKNQALEEDYFALSPLGFWNKEWFKKFVNSKNEREIKKYCKQFFPWWEKEQNGLFWLNVALTLMWQYIPWHTPINQQEKEDYELVADCLERAYKLDSSLKFPWVEWKQILEFLNEKAKLKWLELKIPKINSTASIGFFRRLMRRPLTGYWTIVLPGYFYYERENEGKTVIYWHNDKTVRGSSYTINKLESQKFIKQKRKEFKNMLELKKGEIYGFAEVSQTKENGSKYWVLQGHALSDNSLTITTITFHKRGDKKWAVNTWKSIELDRTPKSGHIDS